MNTAILYVKKGSQRSEDLLKYLAEGGIDEVNQHGIYLYIITVTKADQKKVKEKKGVQGYPTLDLGGGVRKVGLEEIRGVFQNGYRPPQGSANIADSDDEDIKNYLTKTVNSDGDWGEKTDSMDTRSAQKRMAEFSAKREALNPKIKEADELFNRVESSSRRSGGGGGSSGNSAPRQSTPHFDAGAPNNIVNESDDLLNNYFQQAIKREH